MGSVNTACVNASHSSGKAIYVCGRHHVPSTFAQCSLTLFYLCRARQLGGSSKLALWQVVMWKSEAEITLQQCFAVWQCICGFPFVCLCFLACRIRTRILLLLQVRLILWPLRRASWCSSIGDLLYFRNVLFCTGSPLSFWKAGPLGHW